VKYAIINYGEESNWQSCRFILDNLQAAYKLVPEQGQTFTLMKDMSQFEFLQKAKEIKKFRPEKLVILEHTASNLILILGALNIAYGESKWPDIAFHIYGEFSLEPKAWKKIDKIIQGKNITFVCASTRQSSFFRSFLNPGSHVVTCPFPVATSRFKFNQALREQIRSKLDLKNKFTILYTGRVSYQKNVVNFIESTVEFLKKSNQIADAKILIAGGFDNIKAPFFTQLGLAGEYQFRFETCVAKINSQFPGLVAYLGPQKNDDLLGIYCAADCFVSWSTFHDEDFGMAPIEALSTGLPAIITDWGGYSDFGQFEFCKTIPTEIQSTGVSILEKKYFELLQNQIASFSASADLSASRAAKNTQVAEVFSPKSVSGKLAHSLKTASPHFYGFNSKLNFHESAIRNMWQKQGGYFSPSKVDRYYFSNYGHYTGQLKAKEEREL
jgi:glycosyltransferase involved in cell wall biosynthesis